MKGFVKDKENTTGPDMKSFGKDTIINSLSPKIRLFLLILYLRFLIVNVVEMMPIGLGSTKTARDGSSTRLIIIDEPIPEMADAFTQVVILTVKFGRGTIQVLFAGAYRARVAGFIAKGHKPYALSMVPVI